uniref:Uncharacterized protein n=1 Tax=Mutum virus TaxID=2814230 RepID=A0A896IEG8_9VIRU|nr:hypothetical protein [Mutum virus]QSC42388.1 hypothetical protein [Mutum virus]QSC42391.1 hypothetical protein [Mutum virus]QSC42394.1 hypothetical protein [Mutum virus]
MDAAFIRTTIRTQIDIAQSCRSILNSDYILFDLSFIPASEEMVGRYRVSRDSSGRRAILCTGAHKHFTPDHYASFLPTTAFIIRRGPIFYLPRS